MILHSKTYAATILLSLVMEQHVYQLKAVSKAFMTLE